MRPERICREISDSLAAGGTLVCDTGHSAMWTAQTIEMDSPQQRLIRCEGSLGWGLPAAIGAKVGAPDDFVVGFTGDGGLFYHLAELETAARHGVNLTVVVNDNGSMNQEMHTFDSAFDGKGEGAGRNLWTFVNVDLCEVAKSLGCLGIRAETPAELRDALQFGRNGSDRPVVIAARSDPSAVAPVGWRRQAARS